MTAATLKPRPSAATNASIAVPPAQGGVQVLAAWRVKPGALMLLGRAAAPPPAAGVAGLQFTPSSRGVFRAVSWPLAEGGHGVLAAIRLPERADPPDGATLLLRGSEAPGAMLALPVPDACAEAAEFGRSAARLAGPHAAVAGRFALETLGAPAGDPNAAPEAARMLRAFLSQAAQPDGHIEIMVAPPGAGVLLQGWGARLEGKLLVVLAGQGTPTFAAYAGEFSRADTAAPAVGVMLALPEATADALPGVDHVFVLSETGVHGRTVVEHRVLDPRDAAGHIRHMLPSLRCPAAMAGLLAEALRPRWDGRDTLTGNPHPVRAAVDTAIGAPSVGAYLSGWLFDPARQLAELHLCSPSGAWRVDTAWIRVPRPDVTEAFRGTAGFPAPTNHDAGFAVFLPEAGDGPHHLRATFTDGDRAFVPIALSDPADAAVRTRLLAGIDLYKPSGLPIIERHAAPLMARVRPGAPAAPAVLLAGPAALAEAVVVPLAAPVAPRALLSSFLHDPLEGEHLILVCGPAWDAPALDSLAALVRFYRLPATVLTVAEDGAEPAMLAALQATRAERVLVAAPGVAGPPGWRAALRAGAGRAAFACPTVLYEDWSIRFAGSAEVVALDAAPFAEVQAALAGLPAGLTVADDAQPATSGTLACCLLRRAAVPATAPAGALHTPLLREAAFFHRLRAAKRHGAWVPAVQVYAAEESGRPDDQPGARAARLADGWVMRNHLRPEG